MKKLREGEIVKRDIKAKIYFKSGLTRELCVGSYETFREAMNIILTARFNVGNDYAFDRDSIEFMEEVKQ
jgi:hypothetical protein